MKFFKKSAVFFLFLVILAISSIAFCEVRLHDDYSSDNFKAQQAIDVACLLFADQKHPLTRDVDVYIFPTKEAYIQNLRDRNIDENVINQTTAFSTVCTLGDNIIMYTGELDEKEARRTLIHELVHQMQLQEVGYIATTKMYLMEGLADIISYTAVKEHFNTKIDKGIPASELCTPDQYAEACSKYGAKIVYEQSQYLTLKEITRLLVQYNFPADRIIDAYIILLDGK